MKTKINFIIRFIFITNCLFVNDVISQVIGCGSISICSDNTVMTWGINSNGQLGTGPINGNYTPPTQIPGLTGIISVIGPTGHTLALKNDGSVWAWGNNIYGELGDSTNNVSLVPVKVKIISGVTAIAGANHSHALLSDSSVWSWGSNYYGVLGIGSSPNINYPVRIDSLSSVVAIAAGGVHTVSLKKDGTVWSWGYNQFGSVGDGTAANRYRPVHTLYITGITAVACGGHFSLALKNDGTVWAWGDNGYGAIGDLTLTNRYSPVQVYGLNGIIAIACGGSHSLALKNDGTVWTWGWNLTGQLGNGTINTSWCECDSMAHQVPGLSGVVAIAGGSEQSMALKNDGTLWAWGYNAHGVLSVGDSINKSTPTQVIGLCAVLGVKEEVKKNEEINIYPNPSSAIFTISSKEKIKNIIVTNLLGEEIKIIENCTTVDLSEYAKGIYFVEIKTEKGVINKKIIKQ